MKRIVAFVLPATTRATERRDADDAGRSPAESIGMPEEHGAGALRLEALVTDQQATRLVDLLIEDGPVSRDKRVLQELLEREVESAGPDAHDLFERIVVPVERSLIMHVYAECNRVKTWAATRLGINRNTLHKKLQEYGMADDDDA